VPYPPKGILAEVGRVAIAGARLDYQLFQIWRHLDPDLHDAGKKTAAHRERVVAARSRPNQYQEVIKRRAREHLVEHWAAYVIGEVEAQDKLRVQRDSLIHQDWVFRGVYAPYTADFLGLDEEEQAALVEEHERATISAAGWLTLGKDEPDFLSEAQEIEQLIDTERSLRAMTDRLNACVHRVANLREQVWPGWIGPDLRGTQLGVARDG